MKSIEKHKHRIKNQCLNASNFLSLLFQAFKKKNFCSLLIMALGLLLLVGSFSLVAPAVASAEISVTITGDGVENPITFTEADLKVMEQVYARPYSTINTWPTKKWYMAEGVRLDDLLQKAKIKDDAKLITFISSDSFTKTFTREQLDAPRYYYPGLKDNHEYFGYIPGSPDRPVRVDTILVLNSVENSKNPEDMNDLTAPMLVMGQRWVTEQTNELFVKNVAKIKVLTRAPDKWEKPIANQESGLVVAGTMVELSTSDMDGDNIHYTTDNSTPTIKSPIYNWVKKRWWGSRSDELAEIIKPIEITRDTTIKAIAIGPGKKDSDIAVFNYQVHLEPAPVLMPDEDNNVLGQPIEIIFADEVSWRAAIRSISIDGMMLSASQYTVNEGKIIIEASCFKVAKEYTIVVEATGFEDAEVTQVVGPSMLVPVTITNPAGGQEFKKGEKVTIQGTVQGDLASLNIKVSDPDGQTVYGPTNLVVVNSKFETSFVLSSSAKTGTYVITLNGAGLPDAITSRFTVKVGSGGDTGPGQGVILTIFGSGVEREMQFTLEQLKAMDQHRQVYSAINTWPTKKWYVGEGVKLKSLLNQAGIKKEAQLFKLTSVDGYTITLTAKELLKDKRYYFPNFKNSKNDGDGHIPGSSAGEQVAETIVGLVSAEGTDNPHYMNDLNALLFMLGQRAVTEQNGQLFVKNLSQIEVLTGDVSQWDAPKANLDSGDVPVGTMVKLSNANMDDDKIHYTTDGSTPTIKSPMYNWIASRWWSSRGDVLDTINHPIEIKEDTTIKAITIGPGRMDSDVVTFSYRVKEGGGSKTETITPDKDSTISLGSEASVEIPAYALQESQAVEVNIKGLAVYPDLPAGFKLASGVYEFSVGDNSNYSFAKSVTIKLSFDPDVIDPKEPPAIYYYDEATEQWVKIGGTISDGNISVQVDHFAKFAVIGIEKMVVTGIISPAKGGTVSLEDEASIDIPAGAVTKPGKVEVKIERLGTFPDLPAGCKLLKGSYVYAFSLDGGSYSFAKKVTIKLKFDPDVLEGKEIPAIYYYDEATEQWVDLGGTVSGSAISVQVDHFTIFAVMTVIPEPREVALTDIDGHWAMDNIKKLVVQGAISGYPDGSFQPDNTITRAEFATVLVKAFKLENKGSHVFADTAGHWAEDYIACAAANEVASGYDGDKFGPDNLITREQMGVMIFKAAKLAPIEEENRFADSAGISGWAREALAAATSNGIMKGYPDNTVNPQGNATRAEAVTVIVNALRNQI
ncbi:S-layer homology domain-containing protein [Syntrophomonas erecta]